MKTTSLRIIGAFLGLSVLGLIVPSVRAEDYVTEINNYVNQIIEDQRARDEYMQSIQDGIDQVVKQRDALLDRGTDAPWNDAPAVAPQPQPAATAPVAAPRVIFPAQAAPTQPSPGIGPKIWNGPVLYSAQAAAQPRPIRQDPAAFQLLVLQNQDGVRQQILQTRQQAMQQRSQIPQQHQALISSVRQ